MDELRFLIHKLNDLDYISGFKSCFMFGGPVSSGAFLGTVLENRNEA